MVGRGDLLERVLGRHIELAGQLVGVEFRQVVVEGQAVAGDAAAHDGGVAREDGGHVGGVFAQIEARCGGHPFVTVGDDLLGVCAERLHVGGDDHSGGVAEQDGLDVVPLARERIDVVVFPEFGEDFVLAGNQRREVYQDGDGRSLDLPAAHADTDAFVVDGLPPALEQRGILLELGVHAFVREVGTDGHVAVAEFAGHGLCLGRDDGVDAADFVAYLPTYLEKEVGSKFGIAHVFCFMRYYFVVQKWKSVRIRAQR